MKNVPLGIPRRFIDVCHLNARMWEMEAKIVRRGEEEGKKVRQKANKASVRASAGGGEREGKGMCNSWELSPFMKRFQQSNPNRLKQVNLSLSHFIKHVVSH